MAGENRNINVTISAKVDGYKKALGEAGSATSSLISRQSALDKASNKTWAGLGKAAKTAGVVAGNVLNATVAASIGLGKQVAQVGVSYNGLQQNSRAALSAMLGGLEAANKQMDKLDEFATKSPFSKDIFITAQQQMLAFGYEAEKVLPTLDAIQNAVAASGGNGQMVGDVAFVLAQIKSAGKITGQDLMQLGQRGINAAELIGSAMGKTGTEIRESITKGTLGADVALDALAQSMGAKYAGATTKIKEQFGGAVDRVKAARRDMSAALMEPLVSKSGGGMLVGVTNQVADVIRVVQRKLVEARPLIGEAWQKVMAPLNEKLLIVQKAIEKIDLWKVADGLKSLSGYGAPLAGVAASLSAMGANSILLSRLGLAVNPLTAGLGALVLASPQARQALMGVVRACQPLIPIFANVARMLGDLVNRVVVAASPAIEAFGRILVEVGRAVGSIAQAILPIVSTVIPPLVTVFSALANAVASIPSPILQAVATFVLLKSPLTSMGGVIKTAIEGFTALRGAGFGLATTFQVLAANSPVPAISSLGKASLQAGGVMSRLGGLAATVFSPLGLAVGSAAAAFTLLSKAQERDAEKSRKTAAAAKAATQEIIGYSGALTKLGAVKIGEVWKDDTTVNALKKYGLTLEQVALMASRGTKGMREFEDTVNSIDPNFKYDMGRPWTDAARTMGAFQNMRKSVEKARKEQEAQKKASDASGESARREASAVDAAKNAYDRKRQAMRSSIDVAFALQDAVKSVNDALNNGGTIAFDASGAVDITGSSRGLLESLSQIASAQERVLTNMREQDASQADINAKIGDFNQAWVGALAPLGLTDAQLQQVKMQVGAISSMSSQVITIDVNTAEGQATLNNFLTTIRNDHSGILTIDANNNPAIEKLALSLGAVKSETGIITLDANNHPAEAAMLALMGDINSKEGRVKITANPDEALARAQKTVADIEKNNPKLPVGVRDETREPIQAIRNWIRSQSVTIPVGVEQARATGGAIYPVKGYMAGGAVYGVGHSTADKIPARLSGGEHVLSAKDVRAAGGQNAVYAWRASLHKNPANSSPSFSFPEGFHLEGAHITGTIGIDGQLIDGRITARLQAHRRAVQLVGG
ncbi:tape measure protein [Actinotignum urinale]|uniref:tape measure protein n=1 Tax=Actinotignum urinale TaxID=190146 RepID=UPI0003B68FAD|nr:tape measure protein [Actinotignum urinale]MDY5159572.1 tape measure protein [Actinotignum urinale]